MSAQSREAGTYVERNQGVLTPSLPQDPKREDTSTNNHWGDDVSLTPLRLLTTSKGERNEEESDRSDKKDGTDDVELPEHVRGEVLEAELLERSSVSCEGTGSGSSSARNDENGDDAEGCDLTSAPILI